MGPLDTAADDFTTTPWVYPGTAPDQSVLLVHDLVLPLRPQPGRRLGQAQVSPLAENVDTLNAALLEANVAPVDQRSLVVAVGSNASLAVLRRKFTRGRVSTAVPLLRGHLTHVAVGHSAHVSTPGYLPATPYRSPGARTAVRAALLDDDQLACLDRTEPNYRRHLWEGSEFPFMLELDGGPGEVLGAECPTRFHGYVSRHPLLARPESGTGPRIVPLTAQSELWRVLLGECPSLVALCGSSDPRQVARTLAASEPLRDEVAALLASTGWTRPAELAATSVPHRAHYGEQASRWHGHDRGESWWCAASPDSLDRRGEHCAVLHPADAAAHGITQHAAVSGGTHPDRPPVVVRVVQDPRVPRHTAQLDQVVRNGLGVELHELVQLTPVVTRRTPWADRIIARPHYSLLRVQTADLATVEQDVALMDPLAMSILGIVSGDEVIFEGPPEADGLRPAEHRLKAHAAPPETLARREQLAGGGFTARFPSARSALGVHPDLPWVFLDASSRARLGLGEHRLTAVRVRSSRGYQVARELRELMLLLVLASVGVASFVDQEWVLIGMFVVVTTVGLALLRHRLKHRLEFGSGPR